MVINVTMLKDKQYNYVFNEIKAIKIETNSKDVYFRENIFTPFN